MSSALKADLHLHTDYSFDSVATFEQYCVKAMERGISVLCFTDHIECGKRRNTFDGFPFEARAEQFYKVKQRYKDDLTLLLGFEMSEPHLHPRELQILRSFEPDMIIGSVHYPHEYVAHEGRWSNREYEKLYLQFVYDMVCAGGIDVMGHVDLMKRYHEDFVADDAAVKKCLEKCVKNKIVPEVNVSSLFKGPNRETMPSVEMVKYYCDIGGKYVTVNTDSHSADTVGLGLDEVVSQLPEKIKRCCFVKGRLVELR